MSKKIIYVTSQCPFGNGETWAIREMSSLVEAGVELTIIPRTGYGKSIQKDALALLPRTIAIPFIDAKILYSLFKKIIFEPIDFIRILKWIIGHSNSFFDLIKGLVVLPKSIFISRLLKEKEIEHVHAFSTTSVATFAYILSHELKIPWSITIHASWHFNSQHRRSTNVQLNSVSFVRAISNEVNHSLVKFVGKQFSAKVRTLHIGVKCDSLVLETVKSESVFNIVSVGSLDPRKGVDVSLLAAYKLLNSGISNFNWIIYGEGPLMEDLIQKTVELNLTQNVTFAGNIDNKDLLNLYQTSKVDLLIQNSITRFGLSEGIPVSIMEAMAHGIPVIATDCGGTKELVDGKSGILVNQNDPEAVSNAIIRLLSNPEYRRQIGDAGREKVVLDFNAKKIATELIELF